MAPSMEDWCKSELSKLLSFSVTDDFIKYILNIEDTKDAEEYLRGILSSSAESKRFIADFLLRLKLPDEDATAHEFHVYRKGDDDKLVGSKKRLVFKPYVGDKPPEKHQPASTNNQRVGDTDKANQQAGNKKKSKFVPLYGGKDGVDPTVVHLPGRNPCECQASKHRLVNNCLSCGRVVCQQEGSGPCFFCGKLVCTKEEQDLINSGKGKHLLANLMAIQKQEGLEKAIQHKNKLLDFDKTSEKRTKVIDDQSDYFNVSTSRWLTQSERDASKKRDEEIQAQRHGSRKNRAITLDFAGRKVVETESNVPVFNSDDILQNHWTGNKENIHSIVSPNITQEAPQYEDTGIMGSHKNSKPQGPEKSQRLQDQEIQEMSDQGFCLSMHQPYASLLVAGIKLHEGRSWYSAHRGRLWIAAGSKQPNMAEIKQLEHSIAYLSKDKNIIFPENYPVGCLLGCVDVLDCLPEEQYKQQFPEGTSESPYVLICRNPQELIVKFPIKGKHKIYKLDPQIHKAAKKTLKKTNL